MMENLKSIEVIVGLIVTLITAGFALIAYIGQRFRRSAQDVVGVVDQQQRETKNKVANVQASVDAMSRRIDTIEGRVAHTERQLETVARQADLAPLQSGLSELNGTMRAVSGQLDTLYKAALRAGADSK